MIEQEFRTELINYLEELDSSPELYFDDLHQINFIKIPGKKTLIKTNRIRENAGIENAAMSDEMSANGFTLIQLWEDQWMRQREIVKSRLRALTGKLHTIHGRETKVLPISNPVLLDFLEKNHLHVPLKGKYKLGLFQSEKLVSVASFSYPRNITANGKKIRSYEILRFGHLNHHSVVGGLTKLLKHFVEKIDPKHLMTYIDAEWGTGGGFAKAGFAATSHLSPRSFWVDTDTLERHYTHPINETHSSQMVKIYNCGSIKMEKLL